MTTRTFTDAVAKRERVPLLLGVFGPSGSGKTKSALRLATGMQRVTGGEIFGVDTEHRRMLAYADEHKFRHVDFSPPFSPDDYQGAIEHCVKQGAKIVIIDSMSHEHEGEGGVLEWQAAEAERLAAKWKATVEKANAAAWKAPKRARGRLIQTVTQLGCNALFCFRAKEKTDWKGPKPKGLGFMPVAGNEYLFEMTVNCMLYPHSGGVPTWDTKEIGERFMLKMLGQLEPIFAKPEPLSEDIGQQLAEWARGDGDEKPKGKPAPPPADDPDDPMRAANAIAKLLHAPHIGALNQIREDLLKQKWGKEDAVEIKKAIDARKKELTA